MKTQSLETESMSNMRPHDFANPDPAALSKEVARAMEMMKRVKKYNTVPGQTSSESQPTYLIPDEVVLCQAAC